MQHLIYSIACLIDGWGCGWVSNQIKEDQDGSGWIKGDHSFYQQQRVVSRASMQIEQDV